MISGWVGPYREAIVPLRIRGPQGQELAIDAVVDTGFNGYLTVPPEVITRLGLPFRRNARAMLGDGSTVTVDVHDASVLWGDRLLRISVDAADTTPLLGMNLLYGCELKVEVIEGGDVSIRRLPTA